ncbi:MAG: protein kinase [Gemmataceae bacterium]
MGIASCVQRAQKYPTVKQIQVGNRIGEICLISELLMDAKRQCPGQNVLLELAQGLLPATAVEEILTHIDQCDLCGQRMEAIQKSQTLPGDELGNHPIALLHDAQRAARTPPLKETRAGSVDDTPSSMGSLESSPLHPPATIDSLGPYRILKKLGAGGMGVVYLAKEEVLQRTVALKVMKPDLAKRIDSRKRFIREAQMAARLVHDNIVPIYAVGEEHGLPYLAMPVLKGKSLYAFLKQQTSFTTAQILRIGKQIAQGLLVAHHAGVIHRDIKPSNIWLEPVGGGRVKILDFGLARSVSDDIHITQSGFLIGTPAYMAPEQAKNQTVNHRADLFSLGVVLYQMCTGTIPFQGESTMALLIALTQENPRPVRELNPQIPSELGNLIMQLLAKQPANRPQSAQAVIDQIKSVELQVSPKQRHLRRESFETMASDLISLDAKLSTDTIQAQRRTVRRTKSQKSLLRPNRWIVLLATGVVFVALLVFGSMFIFRGTYRTPNGTFVVEIHNSKIEARFRNGKVYLYDRKGQLRYTLDPGERKKDVEPGEYLIDVRGADGLTLSTNRFTIQEGQRVVVQVTLRRTVPPITPHDRLPAEYALSVCGVVRVNGEDEDILSAEGLPKEPFRLTGLKFPESATFTKDGLTIFEKCQNLTYLNFRGNNTFDETLNHFKHCTQLKELVLADTLVTDLGITYFKNCHELEHLNLFNTSVTNEGLAELKHCKKLKKLYLGGYPTDSPITDAGLAHFKGCDGLTHLSLAGIPQVTDQGLAYFHNCKKLKSVAIVKTKITDDGIAFLQNRKDLEQLTLESLPITDKGLCHFQKLQTLTTLQLGSLDITDAGLANFRRCHNLMELTLEHLPKISDKGLQYFHLRKRLKYLRLAHVDVTDAGLVPFQVCEHILELHLESLPVTKQGLKHFHKNKHLQHLFLGKCGEVDDQAIAFIKDCQDLMGLGLAHTKVSDGIVPQIETLEYLTSLDVRNTKFSKQGALAVHAALPLCHITWNGGIIEGDPSVDRYAATYVLSCGGAVTINGEATSIYKSEDLPLVPFCLTGFHLGIGSTASDEGLGVFEGCEHLASVSFEGNTKITDVGLAHFSNCKLIKELLFNNSSLTDDGLSHFRKCQDLRKLRLLNTQVTDKSLAHFRGSDNLTELWVGCYPQGRSDITNVGLSNFEGCTKLKELVIEGAPGVTDAGLRYFRNNQDIEFLHLVCSTFTPQGIAHFKGLEHLESLGLERLQDPDKCLATFRGSKHLNQLFLGAMNATDEGLANFEGCKQLQLLNLHRLPNVTDRGLLYFKGCNGLKTLNLTDLKGITDAAMVNFEKCRLLTDLKLVNLQITHEGLANFKNSTKLTNLGLGRCHWIVDEGLAHFQNCQKLQALDLAKTQVGDSGLQYLEKCQRLETIRLQETKVSEKGVARLQKALPRCSISWDGGNVGSN